MTLLFQFVAVRGPSLMALPLKMLFFPILFPWNRVDELKHRRIDFFELIWIKGIEGHACLRVRDRNLNFIFHQTKTRNGQVRTKDRKNSG